MLPFLLRLKCTFLYDMIKTMNYYGKIESLGGIYYDSI